MPRTRQGLTRIITAALALGAVCAALAPAAAGAITQDEVAARAQKRVNFPVPYSQTTYYAGYRTDCSGFVSMCWSTGISWSTRSFHNVTHRIPVRDLRRGDAMLKAGYHVRLFYGWLDAARTRYVSYESGYGSIAVCRTHSIADDLAFGYVPVRYDRITASPRPRNLLENGAFNSWARSWGTQPDQPVWWDVEGPSWEPLAYRRTDTYRTAYSSVELTNPSEDPNAFTEMSQVASIAPNAVYRFSAYAKTAHDPHAVELRLAFLDASGEAVRETMTTGDSWRIDAASFRPMSILASAPADAVCARVSVRLSGGSTADESGTVIPGTSVVIDDIALVRPQVTVSIQTSARTAYSSKTVMLSGVVGPAVAVGQPAVVWVKRPGSEWTKLTTTTAYASGTSAAWRRSVTFTRHMPKGTYRFRTAVGTIPGYLGAISDTVCVTLR